MTLPSARGEVSAALIGVLARRPARVGARPFDGVAAAAADPYGEDLHLALYLCYELHYRGIGGVDEDWEWDARLLGLRALLEERFLAALRNDVPASGDLSQVLDELLLEPVDGTGVSYFLRDRAELAHVREYAALRSLYHLKEGDPHAWVIPRLTGRAKAGFVAVEYDEYGGGRAERMHVRLYADLMADLGLDADYGRYLESGTAELLATVNLMSLLGLHRALRGALVGHFAAVEITSSPGSRRIAQGMARLGAGPAAVGFYAEHVEADAVHEQVVRREVIGGLLEAEPQLERDVAFGIGATGWLEDRLGDRLLGAWEAGRSALRAPL
ncbi:iron-containing redox enzyme family protein [Streptomyces sp. MP131-18]|uniref:iron-containing redox enzyme family protein n=1 Tax=Streptomyces sp. MP131-18 TaxID=1857892 RepID=UPI00097CB460|nr:iron-containing redox enzyme family protein [Streptomyces sp. MP131-18]ONK13854.1 hypothetical protein STBA_46290 [Streptomyces sp. MP131-18]